MNLASQLIQNVGGALLGKPETVRLAVACLLADGHLLIDDIPGVGKTTLALSLSRSMGCDFQRIQFTSDLLPSDVLGVSVFDPKTQTFAFRAGPIFHNVVLADEINRASPKTQSAMLEAMAERQISIDNQTAALPSPFFVIATQNPHEHHGTFPLPESQLDRFMMRLSLGYPEEAAELAILRGDATSPRAEAVRAVTDGAAVRAEVARVRAFRVDPGVDAYMVRLAHATRSNDLVDLGLSPRGTLALRRAAQGYAAVQGRDFVVPEDAKAVAVAVIAHRLRLKGTTLNGLAARSAEAVVTDILNRVPVPA